MHSLPFLRAEGLGTAAETGEASPDTRWDDLLLIIFFRCSLASTLRRSMKLLTDCIVQRRSWGCWASRDSAHILMVVVSSSTAWSMHFNTGFSSLLLVA